jgi:hypothetical protein
MLAGPSVAEKMKMLDTTEQPDRASNPNEKPESCYCSVLPKGSGPCLPCYTRWLAGKAEELVAERLSSQGGKE